MATIAALEGAIRARLEAQVPGPPVKPYPNDPKLYKMFHPKWELLVAYRGGRFEASRNTSRVVQDRTLLFEISALVRDLVGPEGGYALLELIRLALQGWRPFPDCEPFQIRSDDFLNVDAGQWYWAVFAATRSPALPAPVPSTDAPLTQFSFQTPDGKVRFP